MSMPAWDQRVSMAGSVAAGCVGWAEAGGGGEQACEPGWMSWTVTRRVIGCAGLTTMSARAAVAEIVSTSAQRIMERTMSARAASRRNGWEALWGMLISCSGEADEV